MEAKASGRNPVGSAEQLLLSQNRLIGWQIASERAGFALKVLTGLAGTLAVIAVMVLACSASQYRGVTIKPFSVPPEMEARGLTGAVVAERVLDRLARMQAATGSTRAAASFSSGWGEVEVTIPQTGVSATELWKFLRGWLGQEIEVSGDIVKAGTEVQLSVRADRTSAPLIRGPEADLEGLLDRAAEALFAETQTYRYGVYLMREHRLEEAQAVFQRLALGDDRVERKWALVGLTNSYLRQGQLDTALKSAGAVIAADSRFPLGVSIYARSHYFAGNWETSYRANARVASLLQGETEFTRDRRENFKFEHLALDARFRHDHNRALETLQHFMKRDDQRDLNLIWLAAGQKVALHRPSEAMMDATETLGNPAEALDELRLSLAEQLERQDWAGAVARYRSIQDAHPEQRFSASGRYWNDEGPTAYAMARLGDLDGARSLLAQGRRDSYPIAIARAQVAALSGDVAGSERLFVAATELAPSLADAHFAWGRARLERGDAAGAIAVLKIAAHRAPRWADPLKVWGDALSIQGRHKEAIRLYQAAARFAPQWGALHLAWGRSLVAQGREDKARDRWRAAAGMDLSATDRGAVSRLLVF
jgi:tetratricopeptide (TPR) repeat protein